MPPQSFATLVNRKLLIPSSKTAYLAIEREFLIAILAPALAEIHLDEPWYLAQNPDVRDAIANRAFNSAADHFCRVGFYEHRMPYPIEVDETWYLKSYPDIAAAVTQGAVASGQAHFQADGYREGRFPHPDFALSAKRTSSPQETAKRTSSPQETAKRTLSPQETAKRTLSPQETLNPPDKQPAAPSKIPARRSKLPPAIVKRRPPTQAEMA